MNVSLMVKRQQEDARLTALVAEIALEQGVDVDDRPHRATAAGDERKLRGIPAVGRGVSGHMNGTRPDQALR